jgi:excisionase family DNA binding protein
MERTATPILTPDWMKTSEAAARMGCTQMTVRNRLKRGSIPVRWVRIEHSIHLNRAQFLAWLEGDDCHAKAS